VRLAVLGAVDQRILQAPGGVVTRPAGVGHFDTEEEPVIGVRQIAVIGLAMESDVVVVRDLQQLFEVAWLPHQAVRAVRQDVPHLAIAGGFQQRIPPGALPVPLPRGAVVVDEHQTLRDGKSQPLAQFPADALLAVDARLVVVVDVGDTAVDGGRLARPVGAEPPRALRFGYAGKAAGAYGTPV
jgi:hypothetical protein